MNKILFSTGVFISGENNRDHSRITNIMPRLISTDFEILVSRYFSEHQDEYEAAAQDIMRAKEAGATFPVMHVIQEIGTLISRNQDGDIEKALQIFDFNCKYAVQFESKLLVMHLWGGRESDKNIAINIDTFPKLKKIADQYGLILTIENVVCNTYKPLEHMKRLWDLYGNDVKFTIDIRHAEFHKSLKETCESPFLWENNLVSHVHISDYKGEYMDWQKFLGNNTPITYGDVDFDYFFAFLKSIHYNGSITIENNRISENEDLVFNFNQAYHFVKTGLE